MIKNPSFVIAWSMIKVHQKGAIILLASIPIMLLIKFLFNDYLPQEHSSTADKLYSIPPAYITIYMTMIFTFAEFNRTLVNLHFQGTHLPTLLAAFSWQSFLFLSV